MPTRKSSSTIYERVTPSIRKRMREFALSKECSYCHSQIGEPCKGMAGKVAAPHWVRRVDFRLAKAINEIPK